jgi:aryl sulfotransferase
MPDLPNYPVKTRELHNHHFDSTIWNDFAFRDDDIVIATYAKSGTTWVQQIVSQLIFNGAEGLPVAEMSPWLDLRVPPKEVKLPLVEAQTHRRFLKTHLPVDALVFSPKAKYIYIGRDGRDVMWSMYNHHANANALWYEALNDTPGLVGDPIAPPPASVVEYFRDWLARDGHPFWPFWENVRSWWAIRGLPNVHLVHFQRLKDDMPGEIRRIAAFLEIPIDEAKWEAILEHCSFAYMKRHRERAARRRVLGRGRRDLHPQGDERPLARGAERGGQRRLRAPRHRRARTRGGGLAAYRKPLTRKPEHP